MYHANSGRVYKGMHLKSVIITDFNMAEVRILLNFDPYFIVLILVFMRKKGSETHLTWLMYQYRGLAYKYIMYLRGGYRYGLIPARIRFLVYKLQRVIVLLFLNSIISSLFVLPWF